MKRPSSRWTSTACLRETVTSSRKMSQSGERPIVRALALRQEVLARTTPTRADDQRRPLGAEVLEGDGCLVSPLLRRVAHRRLAPRLVLDEQRAAAGTVIRGLRVLEAALRAVDVAIGSRCGSRHLRSRLVEPHARAQPCPRGSPRACPCRRARGRPAARLPQASLQLRAQDVDLSVQDPAPVRDLLLLLRQVVDQLLEIVVGKRCEIGKGFHGVPFVGEATAPSVAGGARRFNLSLRLLPPARPPPMISSTSSRSSSASSSELLTRLALGVDVDDGLVGVGQHLRPSRGGRAP